jgi:bifunctional non-homologous end joining protein LigD
VDFGGAGEKFFEIASQHGLEGMVSKRADMPYRSGRSNEWLKVKIILSDDFAIIGYQPDGRGGIANLKLAIEDKGALRYAGAVASLMLRIIRNLEKRDLKWSFLLPSDLSQQRQ